MTRDEVVREMVRATQQSKAWSSFWSPEEIETLMRVALAAAEKHGWHLVEKHKREGRAYTDELGIWHYAAGDGE